MFNADENSRKCLLDRSSNSSLDDVDFSLVSENCGNDDAHSLFRATRLTTQAAFAS